jgi:dolichyl-phosphate-mannose--protein O-mannosyl transferase
MNKGIIAEILIYFVSAISALFIIGFAVHMLIGGEVSQATEYQYIAVICFIVACVIIYMAWDVIQKRSGKM